MRLEVTCLEIEQKKSASSNGLWNIDSVQFLNAEEHTSGMKGDGERLLNTNKMVECGIAQRTPMASRRLSPSRVTISLMASMAQTTFHVLRILAVETNVNNVLLR
jgi:hypothetical protein